jgi:predicted glycoside hydrolase/deacetylase ChbG (UPF0249 family)
MHGQDEVRVGEPKAAQDNRGDKRLIVCVDDFGLDEAVDGSVFALAAMGRISATGALVDAPRWRVDGPRLVREFDGRLDIGLHLNLSEAFAGGPKVGRWDALVLKAYARLLDARALKAEIGRQLDAFTDVAGRAPDFVDGHRHVHQLPVVRQALVEALQARSLRPWLRCTLPAAGVRLSAGERFKAAVIGALGAGALQGLARNHGIPQNRRMLGVYGFDGSPEQQLTRLEAWLSAAQDSDLLMCHTALPERGAGPQAGDPIAAARRIEHALLASQAFADLIQRNRVRIARLTSRA